LSNFKSELNKEHSAAIACSQTHSYFYLVYYFKVNFVFHKGTLSTVAEFSWT